MIIVVVVTPVVGALTVVCFVVCYFISILVLQSSSDGASCFAWFVFLVSRDCCVAFPRGAMGLSAVCDCGIF